MLTTQFHWIIDAIKSKCYMLITEFSWTLVVLFGNFRISLRQSFFIWIKKISNNKFQIINFKRFTEIQVKFLQKSVNLNWKKWLSAPPSINNNLLSLQSVQFEYPTVSQSPGFTLIAAINQFRTKKLLKACN